LKPGLPYVRKQVSERERQHQNHPYGSDDHGLHAEARAWIATGPGGRGVPVSFSQRFEGAGETARSRVRPQNRVGQQQESRADGRYFPARFARFPHLDGGAQTAGQIHTGCQSGHQPVHKEERANEAHHLTVEKDAVLAADGEKVEEGFGGRDPEANAPRNCGLRVPLGREPLDFPPDRREIRILFERADVQKTVVYSANLAVGERQNQLYHFPARLGSQKGDNPEVDITDHVAGLYQQVRRVQVGVEGAEQERVPQEVVYDAGGEGRGFIAFVPQTGENFRGAGGVRVIDQAEIPGNAWSLNKLEHQNPGCRIFPENPGNPFARNIFRVAAEVLAIARLAAVIEFGGGPGRKFPNRFAKEVEAPQPEHHNDPDHPLEKQVVAFEDPVDTGALNLDCHRCPIRQRAPMYLANGGGRDGRVIELVKEVFRQRAEFPGHDAFDFGALKRRNTVEQREQSVAICAGQQLHLKGQHLPELDECAAEGFETLPHQLRPANRPSPRPPVGGPERQTERNADRFEESAQNIAAGMALSQREGIITWEGMLHSDGPGRTHPGVPIMRRIVLLCFACLIPAAAALADELSLEQVIALAVKSNRVVTNASLEVEKSDRQIDIARTYRLPTFKLSVFEGQFLAPVNFEFPAGAWGVFAATGPIPATNTKISSPAHPFTLINGSMTQPLTQFPRIRTGIRMRETERDEAREKLEAARQATISDARKLYYGILQTQSAVTANESSIESLRELDRVTSESVSHEVALKSEALAVKARLAKAEYEGATLLHDLAAEKEQLNDLMGRDSRTEFTVRALPEPSLAAADLAQTREHALAERPEIHEARLHIREAELDRKLKHAEIFPTVDFTVQYLSPFQIAILPTNIAAAGFQLNWDVFDWGRRNKELAIKDVVIKQAKNALETVQSQVLIEVESRYRKLEEARRMLQVVQMAQEAAHERVRIARDRYDGKEALLKDLLEAQAAQAETDYQHQEALSSYLTAQADFDRAGANK
jgi:outer membrane protein TolC